jgi:hypothetical protein
MHAATTNARRHHQEADAITGPSQPELSHLYGTSWNATAVEAARNIYHVARTAVAFGQAAELVWRAGMPLCAGYHDQDVVFRLFEPT